MAPVRKLFRENYSIDRFLLTKSLSKKKICKKDALKGKTQETDEKCKYCNLIYYYNPIKLSIRVDVTSDTTWKKFNAETNRV